VPSAWGIGLSAMTSQIVRQLSVRRGADSAKRVQAESIAGMNWRGFVARTRVRGESCCLPIRTAGIAQVLVSQAISGYQYLAVDFLIRITKLSKSFRLAHVGGMGSDFPTVRSFTAKIVLYLRQVTTSG
jgi:hypothetical protein